MIEQTILQVFGKQILVMFFAEHLSMVEITNIFIGDWQVAFDPCELVHIFPDDGMEHFTDYENPNTIEALQMMAYRTFFYGEN